MARKPIGRGVTMPTAAAGVAPEDPDAIMAAMETSADPEPSIGAAPAAPAPTPMAAMETSADPEPSIGAAPAAPAPTPMAAPLAAITVEVPPIVPTIADRSIADRSSERSFQRSEERSSGVDAELEALRAYRDRMERREQGLPQHPRHQDNTKLQAEVEHWVHRALRSLHGDSATIGIGFGKLVTSVLEDGLRAKDPDLAARMYAARAQELGADNDWSRDRDPIRLTPDTRARLAWVAQHTGHSPSELVQAVLTHWMDTQGVPTLGPQA